MGDNYAWMKLWFDFLTDMKTARLSHEEAGFLVRLWVLIRKEGTEGSITLTNQDVVHLGMLQCANVNMMQNYLHKISVSFTNMNVTRDDVSLCVSFPKFMKRQADKSTPRVWKYRDKNRKVKRKNETHQPFSLSTSINKGIKEESEKPLKENGLSRFDEFWQVYPKRKDRAKAEKAWKSLRPDEKEAAINAIPNYPFSKDEQFIKYPASWINAKAWLDEDSQRTDGEYIDGKFVKYSN